MDLTIEDMRAKGGDARGEAATGAGWRKEEHRIALRQIATNWEGDAEICARLERIAEAVERLVEIEEARG